MNDSRYLASRRKRALDVLVGGVALVLASPLLALAALAIRLETHGHAVYRQRRVGRGGVPFRLYKLRTMRVEADVSARWAAPDDPRITRVGTLLRRSHLDELPQLVNVLRGEMSLVGPRADIVEQVANYSEADRRRLAVKPGITGWAQVRCGYAGSDTGSAWKLCHDLYYIKHRSFGLDALILGETIALWFRREKPLPTESAAYVLGERS